MAILQSVCVYCASSSQINDIYKKEAFLLGQLLANAKVQVKFGSGSVGLMGELARGVLSRKGTIIGVIPQFMVDEGWGNDSVSHQIITESMHERKEIMSSDIDAAIALPGGCGTLEELLELITWKQLGLFFQPIIILNTNHYYDPLLDMFSHIVDEHFMRDEHQQLWTVVDHASDIIPTILNTPKWRENARETAAL